MIIYEKNGEVVERYNRKDREAYVIDYLSGVEWTGIGRIGHNGFSYYSKNRRGGKRRNYVKYNFNDNIAEKSGIKVFNRIKAVILLKLMSK